MDVRILQTHTLYQTLQDPKLGADDFRAITAEIDRREAPEWFAGYEPEPNRDWLDEWL